MIANIISTHKCNLRCKHCYYVDNLQKEDNDSVLDNWKLLQTKCEDLNIEKFNFSGGEATTSPHITAFFADCLDRTIPYSLFSNGIVLDPYIIDMCNEYYISVDGIGKIHDSVRNFNGAYEKTYTSLSMLKNQRKSVHIQTTINKINVDSLDPLIDMYLKFAPVLKSISLVGVINQGNALLNEIALPNADLLKIKQFKEKVLDAVHYHVFIKDNLYTIAQLKEFVLSPKSTFPIWVDLVSGEAYVMNENFKTSISNLSHSWILEQYNLIRDSISNAIVHLDDGLFIIEELL